MTPAHVASPRVLASEGTDYGAVWDTLVVDLPVIREQLLSLEE